MADPLMTRYRSPPQATMIERLRAAALDFRDRWRSAKPRRSGGLRHLEAAGVLLAVVAILIVGYNFDAAGVAWQRSLSTDLVRWFFEPVTRLGGSGYIFFLSGWIAIGAVVARGRGLSRVHNATLGLLAGRAAFVFGATALSGILSQLIKHLMGRARPSLFDVVGPYHFDVFSISARFASFPSGHTVTAFTVALALGWFMPRWRWPLLAVAALVGISRIAVGAHFPSDVLAGALLGIGSTLALRKAFAFRHIVFRPKGHGFVARCARPALQAVRRIPVGRG